MTSNINIEQITAIATQAAIAAVQAALTANVPAAVVPHLTLVPTEAVKAEPEGLKFMELRQALRQHKAAGAIKPGLTVKEAIAAGLMDTYGNLTGTPVVQVAQAVATVAEVKPAKPAKVKRTSKPRATEPEYGTAAWIEWARPTDDGAPRRANGSTTPKREWPLRMILAESGQYTAEEMDRAVADAITVVNS